MYLTMIIALVAGMSGVVLARDDLLWLGMIFALCSISEAIARQKR